MNTFRHIALAAALLGSSLAAQASGTLVITPSTSTVNPGDTFTVFVRGSAFTDNVVGGGFSLSFDPGVLSLLSVTVDTAVWEFVSSNGAINNTAGTLSDVYFNSFRPTLPTGSFAVAMLQFSALAGGSSALQLGASPDFPFSNDLGNVIDVAYQGATVSAVPEPATLALWALGLVGVAALKQRRAGAAV